MPEITPLLDFYKRCIEDQDGLVRGFPYYRYSIKNGIEAVQLAEPETRKRLLSNRRSESPLGVYVKECGFKLRVKPSYTDSKKELSDAKRSLHRVHRDNLWKMLSKLQDWVMSDSSSIPLPWDFSFTGSSNELKHGVMYTQAGHRVTPLHLLGLIWYLSLMVPHIVLAVFIPVYKTRPFYLRSGTFVLGPNRFDKRLFISDWILERDIFKTEFNEEDRLTVIQLSFFELIKMHPELARIFSDSRCDCCYPTNRKISSVTGHVDNPRKLYFRNKGCEKPSSGSEDINLHNYEFEISRFKRHLAG